jgi:hypothetical protein
MNRTIQNLKNTVQIRRYAMFLIFCGLALMVSACSQNGNEPDIERRILNTEPVKVLLKTPLPPGRAEAFIALDTGADQMMRSRKEAGLMVVVRSENNEYKQTIASCQNPSLGSALGGGTERELEVAICDGEYWLISEPGVVSVLRMDKEPRGKQVFRFTLPGNILAVRPQD